MVERAGRSVTALSARLVQDGEPVVLALAAFAVDFPGAPDWAAPAPVVPAAAAIAPVGRIPGAPSIFEHLVVRPVLGAAPFGGGGEALTGGWLRLAEPRPADALACALYCDGWLPSAYIRLSAPAPAPTTDLTIHLRARLPQPGADPAASVLCRFRSTTSAGGFFEEDGEVWSEDGVLLAQSRQLALLFGPRAGGAGA